MLVLTYILVLSAIASTLYWLVLFVKITLYKESSRYANFKAPSIVIAAKNEAQNLKKHLPKYLKQEGIQEVVIIDDFSTDKSDDILQSYGAKDKNLKHLRPSLNKPGKKLALTEGIQSSKAENILLTDADCYPVDKHWARYMCTKLMDRKQLVLGYGPIEKSSGLINRFARFETVITAIQYFGYCLFNVPYMGVGRNMAFTKSLFKQTNGYSRHADIASGDDDLFVQDACKHTEVQICLEPKSFIYSEAPQTLKDYIRQKKRHVATSTRYTTIHKLLLSIHPFFHILVFCLSIVLVTMGYLKIVLVIWFMRWLSISLSGYLPFSRLDGKDLIFWIPLLDILLVAYYIYFGMSALNSKNAHW